MPRKRPACPLVGDFITHGFPFRTPGNIFAVDTETTGLDAWGTRLVDRPTVPARPFAASFCNTDGETAYLRWKVNPETRDVIIDPKQLDLLRALMENPALEKVFFNAIFDKRMVRTLGVMTLGMVWDAMIGMHTIKPDEMPLALKPLSRKYLEIEDDDQTALKASVLAVRRQVQAAKRQAAKGRPHDTTLARYSLSDDTEGDYFLGDPDICETYAVRDALRTISLHIAEMEELESDEQLMSVYKRELRLTNVIEDMEQRGTRLDNDRIKSVIGYYTGISNKARKEIAEEAGTEFNPNSPKQMTAEFYGKRGYTPLAYGFNKEKNEKTRCQHCKGHGCNICQDTGNNPKCDADFLEGIAITHEADAAGNDKLIVKDKLAHALLYESACDTMLSYAKNYDKYKVNDDCGHIIHPNFKQVGTKTGRLSAEKPNMQNVASDESGKKRVDVDYKLRECFIPRDGYVFYIPDYSQIEVWLLFLRAGAMNVVKVLAAGGDAHQIVADFIWGGTYNLKEAKDASHKDPSTLSKSALANLKMYKQTRKRAKNLQFCKIYGGGVTKIATMINCPKAEAEEFIADYDERLPEVKKFMHETVVKAKRDGFIRNGYGRRYPIDRRFAYRATNYDIQGTAADLIKQAMINVHDLQLSPKYRGKMHILLTIHDELIIEVHHSVDSVQTQRDIAEAMSRDYKLLGSPIPFPIGMKVAKDRWSESIETKI